MRSRVGRFEIQAELGRGGFGQVFRAFDPVVERVVAIKVLTAIEDAGAFARFKNEATAAGHLDHPNVVTIYEFGQEGNTPYIVMEFLDGEDLQQIIKANKPLSLYQKLSILDQVADGLHCAHRKGVLHRDVKPANIMVRKDGSVKVMDFGIARLVRDTSTRLTQDGYLIGTVVYMAPELFTGVEIEADALCDIWAYGVVLYEFLSGRNPFQTGSVQSEMYRIINQDPEPLRLPDCPAGLDAVIARLLCRQREHRYQTLEDARFDLRPILKNLEQTEVQRLLSVARELQSQRQWAEALAAALDVRRMDPLNATARILSERAQEKLQRAPGAVSEIAVERKVEEETEPASAATGVDAPTRQFLAPDSARPAWPSATPTEEPPLSPAPVAQAPESRKPGEFTRQFLAAQSALRDAQPGEEMPSPPRNLESASSVFKKPPAPPPPPAPSALAPESGEPGEFTRQFLAADFTGQALQDTPPNEGASPWYPDSASSTFRVPPAPESRDPFGRTLTFQTRPAPPPGPSDARAPGEFTQFLVSPGGSPSPTPEYDPFLVIASSSDPVFIGRSARVARVPFRIGRSRPDVQFPLAFDNAVSGVHAEIDFASGGYVLRDLDSENGTFISGRRLRVGRDEPLFFGARILLGSNTQLVFGSGQMEEIPDLTGHVIANGRFLLQKKLHPGVKSAVYSALDQHLACPVAIKILSPRLANYPGYREQFQSEAVNTSGLYHPNICPVLDQGETDIPGQPGTWLYVAMKYLDGGSLSQRLAENQPFDLGAILSLVDGICSGLDHIHQKGVIHSGIKPSAIVFDAERNPYLTDFAYATKAGKPGPKGIGAPSFHAPEQWEGDMPTHASDQYSFGVLIYLTISGSLPHEGQENPVVREGNLRRGAIPVREMARRNGRKDVPPGIDPVLQRAIARQPAERFASAGEFARQFRQALQTPVSTEPASRTPLIFLSYHRSSSAILALLIKRELDQQGWSVFVDSQQKDTVGRFPLKIERNIENSDLFLCILAEHTLESSWVNREIELAVSLSKPMIPIFQGPFDDNATNFPPHVLELLNHDGVRFIDTQSYYMDAFLKWLIDAIKQLLRPDSPYRSAR